MAKATASSSIRSRVLQRTLTAATREFEQRYDQWQSTYSGFRKRMSDADRSRLDQLGQTIWRFDLRHRWAVGVTGLEFDDTVITKATTAATRQGYFLLMRLVDLWFSIDLAFELYRRMCVPSRVKNPSLIESLRHDSNRRLRAVKAATFAINQDLKTRLRKKEARVRCTGWLRQLADGTEPTSSTRLSAQAAKLIEARRVLGSEHFGSMACLTRNYYVHGGETASSRGLPAQEKVPILRLLVGFTSIASLSLATAAADEMLKQPARLARFEAKA